MSPVEWQSIPGSPLILQKESAAVAAGQPPEVDNNNSVYWYSQGEMADVKELVAKYKDTAGGMFPIAISSQTMSDGAVCRRPLRGRLLAGPLAHGPDRRRRPAASSSRPGTRCCRLGPSIQQPPRNNLLGLLPRPRGRPRQQHHAVSCGRTAGGSANENGEPDIINPANKAGIEMIVKLWEAKLILPDSFAQTVTSWNNESYQKGRALATNQPGDDHGLAARQRQGVGEKTGLALTPKGPAGSFAEGGAIGFNYFKKAQAGGQGAVGTRVPDAAGESAEDLASRSRGGSCRSTATTPRATSGRRASSPR